MAAFVVLGVELLAVPVGAMGHFWPGDGPFRAVGGLVGCAQGWGLGSRMSLSGVYPAGGLRWHFPCGFNFGCGL